MNNFHYIDVLLDILYGIEINDEDVEELGLRAWDLIGNKNTKLYRYKACVGPDNTIKLPCNAISVESVTTSYEDWNDTTNYSRNGDYTSSQIESYIES